VPYATAKPVFEYVAADATHPEPAEIEEKPTIKSSNQIGVQLIRKKNKYNWTNQELAQSSQSNDLMKMKSLLTNRKILTS
jgi:hypothetical protein